MAETQPYIFISYRRSDAEPAALKIYEQLNQVPILQNRIFFDKEQKYGDNFESRIGSALQTTRYMLVLIGPTWATVQDKKGNQRLSDPDDWVRREIDRALQNPERIKVMPVLLNGASMPSITEIPKSLHKITPIIGYEIEDPDKEGSLDELVRGVTEAIEKILSDETPSFIQRHWKILLAALLILVVGLVAGLAWALSQEESPSGQATRPTNELPTPPELPVPINLSDLVLRENGLVVVESANQSRLWGYGYEAGRGVLFAVDVASAKQVPPKADSESLYYPLTTDDATSFLPGVIGYDGQWLWVGDLGTNTLVAFDATDLSEKMRISLPGQPVVLAYEGNILWIATHSNTAEDEDHVLAVSIDHTTANYDQFCDLTMDTPIALESDGGTAIWVLYGQGAAGMASRISPQECQLRTPLALNAVPLDLTISEDGFAWIVAGGKLQRIPLDAPTQLEQVALNNSDFKYVQAIGNNKLLLARPASVIVYDISQAKAVANLPLNNDPQSVIQFGAQTWIATVRGELLQYVIPTYTVSDLVDMVEIENVLWTIDKVGNVCSLQPTERDCFGVALNEEQPTAIVASRDPNLLWIATNNATIWQLDLRSKRATAQYTLDIFANALAEENVDDTTRRLWASTILGVVYIDLITGDVHSLNRGFNERPPDEIAYDGTSLWFAYAGMEGTGGQGNNGSATIESVSYRTEENSIDSRAGLDVTSEIRDMVVTREAIYVASNGIVRVARKSPLAFFAVIGAGQNLDLITGDADSLWAANSQSGVIYQLTLEN